VALEDILKALEEKAEARIETIYVGARQRAKEIHAESEKDVMRTRRLRLKKVDDQIHGEATGIIYSASLKSKNLLIKAQEETVDEAFMVARERLSLLSKTPEYSRILEVLLEECLDFFPEGEVLVEARADDISLVKKMMAHRKRQYRIAEKELEASGGLVVSSPGGQVVVSNTFESRLKRARDHLRLDISEALFGDEL